MENLGDILKRLATTRSISAGDPPVAMDGDYSENGGSCELCGGRGWFTPDVPVGHPDFGQTFPCDCQGTQDPAARIDALLRYSNLGPLSRISFASTRPDGPLPDAASSHLFQQALRGPRGR